jgi:hypothetical protein
MPEYKTLLVWGIEGHFRITVPSTYKVTFSKAIPQGDRSYQNDYVLRIYETESKQRAVFMGVRGFRDLGLTYEVPTYDANGKITWEVDTDGDRLGLDTMQSLAKAKRKSRDEGY